MENHFTAREMMYSDHPVKWLYRNIQGIHLQTQLKMNPEVFYRLPFMASYKKLSCSQLTVQLSQPLNLNHHHRSPTSYIPCQKIKLSVS